MDDDFNEDGEIDHNVDHNVEVEVDIGGGWVKGRRKNSTIISFCK